MINSAYSSLVGVLNSFTRAGGAAQRVLSLMDNQPDINPDVGEIVTDVKGDIELRDVNFFYQVSGDAGGAVQTPVHHGTCTCRGNCCVTSFMSSSIRVQMRPDNKVLTNVNLKIGRGQVCALVGRCSAYDLVLMCCLFVPHGQL